MPDQQGYLLPNERQILLRRYAPVLVLFPEIREQAPYPDDGDAIYTIRGSYHPRTVELFLKQAKVRRTRRWLLSVFRLRRSPRSLADELAAAEQSVRPEDVNRVLAAQEYQNDPRYAGLTGDKLRAAIRCRLVQQRLEKRIQGFDQPVPHGRNLRQWKNYFELLAENDLQITRAVVYGRLVQGRAPLEGNLRATEALLKQGPGHGPYDVSRARVALQYWFQYYYDDWANRHEGDWEGITVLLDLGQETIREGRELGESELLKDVTLHDVGYAVHEDGYRRLWENVQRTKDDRPIVYVARGSSASYFAWRLEGYPASARLGVIEKALTLPGRLSRGRRLFGRRWDALYSARFTGRDPKNTDWVAVDPEPYDRLGDANIELFERWVPKSCRGVRRRPDFGPDAGYDDQTYHLETDDLFWLEMVQEYGVQWGEDSFLPGSEGPRGISRAERDKERVDIQQLALLETAIERSLDDLQGLRFVSVNAIPELNAALQRLRPKKLRSENSFPDRIRWDVYRMWANILREHPEAWVNGPGLLLRLILRWALYPRILAFIRKKPGPEPLLKRDDPLYYLKSLLALVRRMRYELQMEGSKWDNPFAWARYICLPDTFFYGRTHTQAMNRAEFSYYLDCVDAEMSME
jgi:hypothetical protein